MIADRKPALAPLLVGQVGTGRLVSPRPAKTAVARGPSVGLPFAKIP